MSERYRRLFSLPVNLYAMGSPVVIAAGALQKDNQTGKVLVQLKLHNIGKKTIKAATVSVEPLDTVGNPLGESVTYQYLDLHAARDVYFAQKTPIALPDAATRSFAVSVVQVIFTDNSIWNTDNGEWKPLNCPKPLEAMGDNELAKQFRIEYGIDCENLLLEQKDLWHCFCGAVNHQEETNCHRCNKVLTELQAIDLEDLRKKKEERLAREQAEAEAARKLRKKVIKRGLQGAAILLAVVIATVLLTQVVIPNSKYTKAVNLMEAGQYEQAIAAFEAMDDYKDSMAQIKACQTAILDEQYNAATALMESENIIEAYEEWIALDGYKDSTDKANSIRVRYEMEKLKTAKVGDYIVFGTYEQDNDTSNGKEDIEWLVLEVTDSKMLVISKYALDRQLYNTSYTDVTWETCSLRQWLNNNFLNAAFSAEEQAAIPTVIVSADKNPKYSTDPGKATQDKIFLLSITEVNKYFSSDSARQCKPTDYAVSNGAGHNGYCWWWLRSSGDYQDRAAYVEKDGCIHAYGDYVDGLYGTVRPAMWIDLAA